MYFVKIIMNRKYSLLFKSWHDKHNNLCNRLIKQLIPFVMFLKQFKILKCNIQ